MVCSGVAEERPRELDEESMEMGPDRSKRLDNFGLPRLWGNQKLLRCRKIESSDSDDEGSGGAADRRSPGSRFAGTSSSSGSRRREDLDFKRNRVARDSERGPIRAAKSKMSNDEGIEAVREKLTLDLKTEASKLMKDAILGKIATGSELAAPPPPAGETRPWNLRTRRAACKEPFIGAKVVEKNLSYSPPRADGGVAKLLRLRGSPEKEERPKFSLSLSRKEIEEDFAAMIGQRPPRRPKKRPKNVQKQLDPLFPGSWLGEVSEDLYKVAELPENGKKQ